MLARNASANRRKDRPQGKVRRVPPGTFRAEPPGLRPDRRQAESPAPVMVLAPLLGLGIWGAILYLLLS